MKHENVRARGDVKIELHGLDGRLVFRQEYKNVVTTTGFNQLALAIASTDNYRVNYVALGTSTTPPAASDTTLGAETYRNATASATASGAVAYVTGFFSATEVVGTFKEAGLFIGGTDAANSGSLLSHVSVNFTKTITDTLTVSWAITFS